MEWAANIGRTVARRTGFDFDELIQTAQLALCELVAGGRFDPTEGQKNDDVIGAFRGWAHSTIVCACTRATQAERGGGTFRTVRPENLHAVGHLGDECESIEALEPTPIPPRVIDQDDRPQIKTGPSSDLLAPPATLPRPDPSKITTALDRHASRMRCDGSPNPPMSRGFRPKPKKVKKIPEYIPIVDLGEPDPQIAERFESVFTKLSGGAD
jgi:hypothetical protein